MMPQRFLGCGILGDAAPDCLRALEVIGQLCGAHVIRTTTNQSRLAHDASQAAARGRSVALATGLERRKHTGHARCISIHLGLLGLSAMAARAGLSGCREAECAPDAERAYHPLGKL